jgi:phosphate acyltransferase
MRIGVDVMGGDYAPDAVVSGAVLALNELPDTVQIVLIGDRDVILKLCTREQINPERFDIVHTTEVIGMGDNPAKAYSQKPDSSIAVGFKMLVRHELEGFASAGNTGAMLAGAMFTAKSIPGIIRPAIAAAIPTTRGVPIVLLDVGINPDARPDVLYQYGILGSMYSRHVFGVSDPKVGLLNIGSEEEKGNLITKASYQSMKGTREFNFVGNVEGNDFFNYKKQDVIVCDGFVGNVMLKQAEAFYELSRHLGVNEPFFEKFNFENYGGTPILGINYPAIIGHGISNAVAIKNMICHTREVAEAKLIESIKEAFQ